MEFGSWFSELTGGDGPFKWQQEAAALFEAGAPPAGLDVMTGGGKSRLALAWLWALLSQSGSSRCVPMRLVWVVDRRIVVDAVWEELDGVAQELFSGTGEAAVWSRAQLAKFGTSTSEPLPVLRLRGGVTVPRLAVLRPDQPAVVVGTVAQIGSRLLGRGFGVSRWARPIEMGLVGYDSLIVLDEADIAEGFLSLADRSAALWPAERSCRVIACSATLAASRAPLLSVRPPGVDKALKPRWETPKPLRTVKSASDDVAGTLAAEALKRSRGGTERVLVVANTAGGARRVWNHVHAAGLEEVDVLLLTGRQRDHDADRVRAEVLAAMAAGPRRRNGRRCVVVATQTIEVGADIDSEVLVTECPDTRSLVQRCGRAGRLGGGAEIVVVQPSDASQYVYGDAAKRLWSWLEKQKQKFDASPRGWSSAKDLPGSAERGNAELLTVTAARSFARTSAAGGDPEPYLSAAEDDLTVSLVWREGLSAVLDLEEIDPAAIADWVQPIDSSEVLEIPLREAVRFRQANATQFQLRLGEPASGPVRPGDTLVVDSLVGGLDRWGWAPQSSEPVEDLSAVVTGRARITGPKLEQFEKLVDEGMTAPQAAAIVLGVDRREIGRFTNSPAGMAITLAGAVDRDRDEGSQWATATTLNGHQLDVSVEAVAQADRLGIDPTPFQAAGLLHDCGKADRFQGPLGFPVSGPVPMAKSEGRPVTRAEWARRCAAAQWPAGGRHELASVRLSDLEPLARHLVLTHHGRFRGAHAPIRDRTETADWVGGDDPQGSEIFSALVDKYGPWQLGWFEAIFRSADAWASAHPTTPANNEEIPQ